MELPFGGAALNKVSKPPAAMPECARVFVGAPAQSFETSCQRMRVPQWKPLTMQISTPVMAILATGLTLRRHDVFRIVQKKARDRSRPALGAWLGSMV